MGLLGGFPFVAYGDGVFPGDGDYGGCFGLGLVGVDSVFLGLFVAYVCSDDLVWFDGGVVVCFGGFVCSGCHGVSPCRVCCVSIGVFGHFGFCLRGFV